MKELLLIFLSVFILFRLFRNQIARFVFGQVIKKFEKAHQQQNSNYIKPEGEVTIQKESVVKSSSSHKDDGEYVDFEEVK